jgi:hypothetical protein
MFKELCHTYPLDYTFGLLLQMGTLDVILMTYPPSNCNHNVRYITGWAYRLLLMLILVCSAGESDAQSIGGIGAVLKLDTTSEGHTLPRIQSLVPNSPAAQSLKEGLYIISVNNIPCKNQTLEQIVGNIRGDAGTKVVLMLADNQKGKQAKEYELLRVVIQQTDPADAFNAACEATVKQLKKQGYEIVRKMGSECGEYYFNFDADTGSYNIRMLTLPNRDADSKNAAISARVSEGEGGIVQPLQATAPNIYEARITFRRPTVGMISTTLPDKQSAGSCKSIFIVVYK